MRGAFDVITVWNKWRNPQTNKDEWFRHVITGASWEQKAVRNASGQTASLASTTGVLIAENSQYKSAREWVAGDKSTFFTLQNGDLVARGAQIAEITGASPYTESAIKQSLMPDAFVIRVVQDNTAHYKHGRHIYVEGV